MCVLQLGAHQSLSRDVARRNLEKGVAADLVLVPASQATPVPNPVAPAMTEPKAEIHPGETALGAGGGLAAMGLRVFANEPAVRQRELGAADPSVRARLMSRR